MTFSRPQLPAGTDAYHREIMQQVFDDTYRGNLLPVDSVAAWSKELRCTKEDAQRRLEADLADQILIEHDPESLSGVLFGAFWMIDIRGFILLVSMYPVRDPSIGVLKEVIH